MTGNSKDDDLALVSSIKVTPPTSEQGSTEQYLEKVLELIKESEGALSGTGKHHSDGAHSGERRKKKQTPSSSSSAAAAAASSSSSSASALPSDADVPPTKPRANGAPPTVPRDSERSSLDSLSEPALTPNHPLFTETGAPSAPLAAASSFASADGAAFGGLGLAFPPPSGGEDFLAGGGAFSAGSAGKAAASGAIGGAIGLGSVGRSSGECRNDPTAAFFDDEDEEDDLGAHALSPPVPMFKKEKKKKKNKAEAAQAPPPPPPPPPPQPEDLDDFPEDLIPDDDDFFATSAAPPPPEPPAPPSPTAPPSAPSSAVKEKRRSKKEKKEKERHGASASAQQQQQPSSHVPPIPTRAEDEDFFRQPPSLVAPPEAPELPYHDVVGCAIGSATGRQSPNLIFMPDDDDDAAAKFLRAQGGGAGGVGSGASGGDVSPAGDDECDSPVEESAKLVAPISSFSTNDNHFAAGAGGAAQHTNDGDTAWLRSLKVGILPPERSSEEAWREHIWPHVQEKEVEFTQTVLQSMEPKGAVVEESQVELTVTELKQRAVLIPCYVATYTYEGRQFDLLVHGRTGEVHGKRPWMGSSTYDSVRKNVEHQVFNVRRYVEESLDNLGMGIRM